MYSSVIITVGVIGPYRSGKTCFIKRQVNNTFDENQQHHIGCDYLEKNVMVDRIEMKVNIWEFNTNYYVESRNLVRYSNYFVALFDVNDNDNFLKVIKIIKYLKEGSEHVKVFLVGNQTDLNNRQVSTTDGLNKSLELGCLNYFEISLLEGQFVNIIMDHIVDAYINGVFKEKILNKVLQPIHKEDKPKDLTTKCLIL
ncbi:Uncharacterized protein QTN25_000721 [Entamoeba marina]